MTDLFQQLLSSRGMDRIYKVVRMMMLRTQGITKIAVSAAWVLFGCAGILAYSNRTNAETAVIRPANYLCGSVYRLTLL
jgi:hypothetical protein